MIYFADGTGKPMWKGRSFVPICPCHCNNAPRVETISKPGASIVVKVADMPANVKAAISAALQIGKSEREP